MAQRQHSGPRPETDHKSSIQPCDGKSKGHYPSEWAVCSRSNCPARRPRKYPLVPSCSSPQQRQRRHVATCNPPEFACQGRIPIHKINIGSMYLVKIGRQKKKPAIAGFFFRFLATPHGILNADLIARFHCALDAFNPSHWIGLHFVQNPPSHFGRLADRKSTRLNSSH